MTELTATLKYGKGYEESWLVLRAETAALLKQAIEEATGISGEGITLVDQIHNATSHVHSVARMGTVLGGTVIESSAPAAAPTEKQETPAPAAAPAPSPIQGPTLLERIGDAKTQTDLSDLFLENKAAFGADPSLMTALQAQAGKI